MGKRLERLDRQVAALTAESKAAETEWLSATDPQQERKLKEVYEATKKEVKDRSRERRDLQLMLPGAGESAVCKRPDLHVDIDKHPST